MIAPSFSVLVLCTGNSARSQIAHALIETRGAARRAGRVYAESAGSRPAGRVNPQAIAVLARHGITWDARAPQSIDALAGRRFDLVITVCDNARDACPILPGAGVQVHWGLADPAESIDGDEARAAFDRTYAELSVRIDALLALPLDSMDGDTLRARVTAIHATALHTD